MAQHAYLLGPKASQSRRFNPSSVHSLVFVSMTHSRHLVSTHLFHMPHSRVATAIARRPVVSTMKQPNKRSTTQHQSYRALCTATLCQFARKTSQNNSHPASASHSRNRKKFKPRAPGSELVGRTLIPTGVLGGARLRLRRGGVGWSWLGCGNSPGKTC